MPTGVLYINGKDAYTNWGISLDQNGLTTLMTPPDLKDWVKNEVRTKHGTDYYSSSVPKVAERKMTLTFNLTAADESQFLSRYAAFCNILKAGKLVIRTSYQSNVYYHCLYVSCQQFTEFARQIATFGLQLIEPDPTHHTST